MAILRTSQPSATMMAAYSICSFANGTCRCHKQGSEPCESIIAVADTVIAAAKEQLSNRK